MPFDLHKIDTETRNREKTLALCIDLKYSFPCKKKTPKLLGCCVYALFHCCLHCRFWLFLQVLISLPLLAIAATASFAHIGSVHFSQPRIEEYDPEFRCIKMSHNNGHKWRKKRCSALQFAINIKDNCVMCIIRFLLHISSISVHISAEKSVSINTAVRAPNVFRVSRLYSTKASRFGENLFFLAAASININIFCSLYPLVTIYLVDIL